MECTGTIHSISKDIDSNKFFLSLFVEGVELPELGGLREQALDIKIDKKRKKRSLNANSYMWVLCDKIARKIRSDRETIYQLMLRRYGTFTDVMVRDEASADFEKITKYFEELYRQDGWTAIRVYHGSHDYNSKEMSDLINGVVSEAQYLGIETMTPYEIARLSVLWGKKNERRED